METEGERKLFLDALRSKIGSPYIWGGNGPDDFDCSGYILWGLRCAGFNCHDMTSSEMVGSYFHECKILHAVAKPGDLLFYGPEAFNITHVMAVLNKWPNGSMVLCGARGGNSNTTTYAKAYRDWALVDICSENYWRSHGPHFAVDPFLKKER